MITIKVQPDSKPYSSVSNFDTGSTFKYNARYYFVVMIEDTDKDMMRKTAVELLTGEEIGEYKRTHPCLYPVDLVISEAPAE